MLDKIKDLITGEETLEDPKTKIRYRRAACALAWPYGQEAGSVIVLGETASPPTELGARRHIHVLSELRSYSAGDLLDEAVLSLQAYKTNVLITPATDERFSLLEAFNAARKEARLSTLKTDSPPTWTGRGEGLVPYYAALVSRRVEAEKSLFFGADCSGSLDLERLTPEDSGRRAIELPGVCALCWALEWLDTNPVRTRTIGRRGPAEPLGGY